MFAKIESFLISEDKRRLMLNFICLSSLQGVNYILPLLTFPYLVRILGIEKFGLITFAQAFIQYFVIFTDYGFNLSGTREISINRNNREKVSEIFNSIMAAKFALMLVSIVILSIIIVSFGKFRESWIIFSLTFGLVIGNIIFPVWFFQGMEKMKYITFLNILAKTIFTILIFLCVRKVSDYIFVPAINSLGFIIAGIVSLWIIIKDFKVKIFLPDIKTIKKYLNESTHFFISRASYSIMTSSNTLMLGLFNTARMVGLYSTAQKLSLAIDNAYYPLCDVLYPYMSKEQKISMYKKIFFITTILNTILCIFIFFFADKIIDLIFGSGLGSSINVLRIFSIVEIFSIPALLLGYPLLGAFGEVKAYKQSVVTGSIIHLTGLGLLALFSMINIYTVSFMLLFTEIIILITRIHIVYFYFHKKV